MAYDLQPLVTLEEKKKYLKSALDENWKLFFVHDPDVAFATLKIFGEGYIADEKFTLFEES